MNIPPYATLIDQLEGALQRLDIQQGFSLLDKSDCHHRGLDRNDPAATTFLLTVAQWVDFGYRDVEFLNELYASFSDIPIASLRLSEFLHIRIVQGFRCLASEDHSQAAGLLGLTLACGEPAMSPHTRFVAHFWKGRAHRHAGEYQAAMTHILRAREIAIAGPHPKLAAVTRIHEAWVNFQCGERTEALRLLQEAEDELTPTRHSLFLGNILSARGRFIRRNGEYARALECFEQAIALYGNGWANHPSCARALVNAAYVKRLIALGMQTANRDGQATGAQNARYLQLCQEALHLLDRAATIYAAWKHLGGTGTLLVNIGHLHLESGDSDQAASEAAKAFQLGETKHDQILMARARILQAEVELVHAEEQIGEDLDVARHASLAVQYADEAIELATHTQNKRLLAEAYIIRARVAAEDTYQEWETAKSYVSRASDLLSKEDRDHLPNEINKLKARILRFTGIDHALRQWSDGQTGEKTFQQIQEEFAEIVIPKVWLNNGKNITKVSSLLAMSPKKVRRILRSGGLLAE